MELPRERLLLGIGTSGPGAFRLARDGVASIHDELGCRVVMGALSEPACRLAGEIADGVLLNWLTPDHARRSAGVDRSRCGAGRTRAAEALRLRSCRPRSRRPRAGRERGRPLRVRLISGALRGDGRHPDRNRDRGHGARRGDRARSTPGKARSMRSYFASCPRPGPPRHTSSSCAPARRDRLRRFGVEALEHDQRNRPVQSVSHTRRNRATAWRRAARAALARHPRPCGLVPGRSRP